ncbi:hypothetical protein [Carboxylicivirga sp. N1Y90]|uniref:hypothetical protein n=1 Tax=Carboxylicivirga fragile TaxID=3417571 RepID=UPI003D356FD8|nr:hypothetical protein [Marinilabiliaceae bacterium N1Y90]
MPFSKCFIYNPTCDMAVENGTNSYMAPENLRIFENDISPLMAFLGSNKDKIICNCELNELKNFWTSLNFDYPQVLKQENALLTNHQNQIYPWGWSQLITKKFSKTKTTTQYWPNFSNQDTKELFSRITTYKLAKELSKLKQAKHDFIHPISIPEKIIQIADAEKMLALNPNGIVLKTLWSSSGRGLIFVRNKKDLSITEPWLTSKIRQHQFVLAEAILDKVQDASLQFIINENNEYEFLGINYFDADSQGRFDKEYFHTPNHLQNTIPDTEGWIGEVANMIINSMKAIHLHNKYKGPVGVDALFFKTQSGDLKFYPLIEANLRCNMGLINLALKKRIHSKAQGSWKIEAFKPGEAAKFYKDQIKKNPVVLRGGLIYKGFIPLTSFHENQQFAAWGLIP